MKKLQHCFLKSVFRYLYFSLIHPYIFYYLSIWLSTFPSTLKPVSIQNHAVRILAGISPLKSVRFIYEIVGGKVKYMIFFNIYCLV